MREQSDQVGEAVGGGCPTPTRGRELLQFLHQDGAIWYTPIHVPEVKFLQFCFPPRGGGGGGGDPPFLAMGLYMYMYKFVLSITCM